MKNNFLKPSLLLALIVSMTVSCKKNVEETIPDNTDLKTEKTALHKDFTCRMKVNNEGGPATESNGFSSKRWVNGSRLRVRFRGGSTLVRNKIIQYAKSWEAYANITFLFVTDNANANIKIAFENDGSWSALGTDARGRSTTMNFGWFDDGTSDIEFRRTITHEFGHALGLEHEQSHPDANIPWNIQAVYDYYMGFPNFWSKADIDFNVLSVNSRAGLNYNAYDTKSIMHYPVDASFTTNNRAIAPDNTTISQGDIAYVRTYYPGRN
jgi:serralysin